MDITWDEAKNAANRKKHGVSFEEAQELLLSDGDHLVIFDEEHSIGEDRFISIGPFVVGWCWSYGRSAMPKYFASLARDERPLPSDEFSTRTSEDFNDRYP